MFSERTLLRCSLPAFRTSRPAASLWELFQKPRYIFSYILNRVVVGERAELFQVFLWIMNLPYALNTALLGNLSVCSIRLEFQLHCYLSIQLFLDCLQQQLEVSKNNSILIILCLEISSQDVHWGFTLKCSILIRIPESFVLLCKLNFYSWLLFHRVF